MSQKKPITPHFLLAFKSHLNLDKPLHATFWAVCLVTLFGLLRKANLQCIGFTQFDPSKHLRGGDILFFTDWASIITRWSKTIQFSQRFLTVPLPRIAQRPLCPFSTFIGSSLHPSINWGRADWSDLWKVWLPSKAVAPKTNKDPPQVSGHSFRSGGATLAFQAQIPAELIKRLGDWQSDAYRSYIHIPVKDRMLAVKRLASFV